MELFSFTFLTEGFKNIALDIMMDIFDLTFYRSNNKSNKYRNKTALLKRFSLSSIHFSSYVKMEKQIFAITVLNSVLYTILLFE